VQGVREMPSLQPGSAVVPCGCVAFIAACSIAAAACGPQEQDVAENIDSVSQAYTDVNFGIHSAPGVEPGAVPPAYEAVPGQPAKCGWKIDLSQIDTLTANFGNAMAQYASWSYWYNVVGKAYYWEEGGDGAANSLETVDLFFAFTHGQAAPRSAIGGACGGANDDPADSAIHATWSMWNYQQRARSDFMRLGDEGKGLSFFVVYSCETAKLDQYVWNRWNKIFKGGLRMALGFAESTTWCAPYNCPLQFQHGATFANYLGAGQSVNNAWILAFDDNDLHTFHPVTMAAGNSDADCASRRDGMTWTNFRSYTRRQDGAVSYLCWRHWANAD
jgi:hypothetical protein